MYAKYGNKVPFYLFVDGHVVQVLQHLLGRVLQGDAAEQLVREHLT